MLLTELGQRYDTIVAIPTAISISISIPISIAPSPIAHPYRHPITITMYITTITTTISIAITTIINTVAIPMQAYARMGEALEGLSRFHEALCVYEEGLKFNERHETLQNLCETITILIQDLSQLKIQHSSSDPGPQFSILTDWLEQHGAYV